MGLAWQTSLFGVEEPPAPDATFAGCRRIELDGGAWLDHAPGWLAGSDVLMAELVDRAPWRQRTRHMYENIVDEPRLTAWWGGKEGDLVPPPVVHQMRGLLSYRYDVEFDSVGCNLYRDGRDSVAWHADNVRKVMAEPIVAIVSLGVPRKLLLRSRHGGRSQRWLLGDGDLFVMGGTCQHTWEHCVPKARSTAPRLSVTFRHSQPGPWEQVASATTPPTARAARARTSRAGRRSRAGTAS